MGPPLPSNPLQPGLYVGEPVKLTKLVQMSDMNGRHGIAIRFIEEMNRCVAAESGHERGSSGRARV